MAYKLRRPLFLIFSVIIFLFIIYTSISYKASDEEAYNEVIATMSMEKAKYFFHDHSDSQYKDILIKQIIDWCKEEKTQESFKLALETIPKDHIRYRELSSYYHKYFKVDN